jgi:hypothetical protein
MGSHVAGYPRCDKNDNLPKKNTQGIDTGQACGRDLPLTSVKLGNLRMTISEPGSSAAVFFYPMRPTTLVLAIDKRYPEHLIIEDIERT